MSKDVVWEATLDDIYKCQVTRTDAYTGILTISNKDKTLFSKEVSMSYGALFGPDVADVNYWENICVDYVDSLS